MQELLDVMTEVLFKSLSSVLEARVKVDWSFSKKFKSFFQSDDVLLDQWVDIFSCF